MVAGRTPFNGATTNEILAAILRDEPLPLHQYAPEAGVDLENIVSRALCKERLQRYQTVAELLTDLKELEQRLLRGLAPAPGAIAASRSRKPVLGERDVILLADFDNQTGDVVFDGTLKQALAIQLQQSPFFSLFPEERVRQTLRLMTRSTEERVTPTVAREICVRHNLKALIAGSIVLLGSHYVIALTALHGQTGEALGSELVEARSKEQVLRALARAATRLRAKLGESLSSIQRFDKGLEETTTHKLEAFQAYSLGYEQSLNGRMMDAIQLYKRAVELDPNFAFAWSMLSVHHSLTGRSDLAAQYAEKAYELKERVSDYEQLAITFRYHFMRTGDMNKALDAATLFKRTYPRTSTAPIDLLVSYDLIGQHDQAVAEGREAVRLNPNYAPAYWYLGRALLRANRFDEAKTVLKRALEQGFDLTNIHSAMYLIAFSEGDTTSMQRELDWATGRPEKYVPLEWQAATAAFEGQWSRAKELSRFAIELAGHGETKELAARYATEQALRGAVLEDYGRARADAAQGLKIASGRISLPRAAMAYALCGDVHEVKTLQEELIKRFPEDTVINSIWLPIIRAALELRAGHHARAIDELQATVVYEAAAEFWPQYLRGSAYLKLGRATEAANEFRKILDCRGHAPLSPLYPLAYLQLGRAAVFSGDTASGRTAYEDFLTLWQEADGDLSILNEARHEYSLVPASKRSEGRFL
jgi:tetratricopeptide (TPR) repeat protein